MNQTNAPGKTLLLVVGNLLVIFSVISLIVLIPTFVLLTPALSLGALGVLLLVAVLLSCATVIIDLIAGIMGIVNREKPEKAKVCMSLGITMISITVLNIIFTIISSDFNFFNGFWPGSSRSLYAWRCKEQERGKRCSLSGECPKYAVKRAPTGALFYHLCGVAPHHCGAFFAQKEARRNSPRPFFEVPFSIGYR